MNKITTKDYQRAARDAMKKSLGFAPALKNVVPLEGSDDGQIITAVAFRITVTGKCYFWRLGSEVERAEVYEKP